MRRSALAVVFGLLLHAPTAPPTAAQRPLPPDVRSRFLPEALRTLEEAGFGNIRVARQIMDDMPPDVVIWQYPLPPDPSVDAVARRIDPATEITLIVVEGLPVIPDLTGWRVDHAAEHVAALGVEPRLRDRGVDPARSVVVGQEPPGPARILPPAAVALEAGPMPRDTVLLTTTDTVVVARVDTVRAADESESGQVPVYLVALASVAGLALGGLGVHRLAGGPRRPRPPASEAAPPSPGDAEPPGEGRRGLNLDAFEPLLVDEAIRVTAGRVAADDGFGGAGPGRCGPGDPGEPGPPGGPGEERVP